MYINGQLILEENFDKNHHFTKTEIEDYAVSLGVNLSNEPELFPIIYEGIRAPLPKPWKPCQDSNGNIYYFNFDNGKSTWRHPCDTYYFKLIQLQRKINNRVSDNNKFILNIAKQKTDSTHKNVLVLDKNNKHNNFVKNELENILHENNSINPSQIILKNQSLNKHNQSKKITKSSAKSKSSLRLLQLSPKREKSVIKQKSNCSKSNMINEVDQTLLNNSYNLTNNSLKNPLLFLIEPPLNAAINCLSTKSSNNSIENNYFTDLKNSKKFSNSLNHISCMNQDNDCFNLSNSVSIVDFSENQSKLLTEKNQTSSIIFNKNFNWNKMYAFIQTKHELKRSKSTDFIFQNLQSKHHKKMKIYNLTQKSNVHESINNCQSSCLNKALVNIKNNRSLNQNLPNQSIIINKNTSTQTVDQIWIHINDFDKVNKQDRLVNTNTIKLDHDISKQNYKNKTPNNLLLSSITKPSYFHNSNFFNPKHKINWTDLSNQLTTIKHEINSIIVKNNNQPHRDQIKDKMSLLAKFQTTSSKEIGQTLTNYHKWLQCAWELFDRMHQGNGLTKQVEIT